MRTTIYPTLRNMTWIFDFNFFPMAWFCDFRHHLADYQLLKYERTDAFKKSLVEVVSLQFYNIDDNLYQKFNQIGIDQQKLSIIDRLLEQKNKTIHVTFDLSDVYLQAIRKNPLLMEYIYKIYYLDFLWFNYTMENY